MTLVPVPGHSPGQLAVVVQDGNHSVFLAADSSYTQDALLRGVVDGVGPDEAAGHLTHQRIRAYAANTPTVYPPAHDPERALGGDELVDDVGHTDRLTGDAGRRARSAGDGQSDRFANR